MYIYYYTPFYSALFDTCKGLLLLSLHCTYSILVYLPWLVSNKLN